MDDRSKNVKNVEHPIRRALLHRRLGAKQMPQMLTGLGLDRKRVYIKWGSTVRKNGARSRNFWDREYEELKDLFQLARKQYRKLALQLHPDRGGNHDSATLLNLLWVRIKRQFAKHEISP